MAAIEKVLQDALALSAKERSQLIDALEASLEPDDGEAISGPEWDAAWGAEIEHRLRDLDEGRAKTLTHEEFLSRLRSRLSP